ncbi:putative sodium-coupled neutral amino acid transporter 9 [Stylophora pistillata]|uniref:Putative sodium-coupled neutral amino acid transporter 9 n=1 Tax=Stylophora pistillata TaxID=50429 RepID=A0A2B4S4L7_STYPI|nr:putative sodium-coupled neutral amino acid transporter 9 [Stylophora pistillata]
MLDHVTAAEKGANSSSEVGVAITDEQSPLLSVQLGDSSNSGDKLNFPSYSSERNQNGNTTSTQKRKPFNVNLLKETIMSSLEYLDLAAKFNRYRYISRLYNHNVAGFALGVIVLIVMAGIIFYTCHLIVKCTQEKVKHGDVVEFSDICRECLGKPGEFIAVLFSVAPLVCAVNVFWVLMSSFLFNSGKYIQENIFSDGPAVNSSTTFEVLCLDGYSAGSTSSNCSIVQDGNSFWHVQHTVPYFLIAIFLPLCSAKSPTFFTKFNSLGTLSAVYIIIFTVTKASIWGVNMDFNKIPMFKASFPALTGILTMAYFIHNSILSIMRNQENPKNNRVYGEQFGEELPTNVGATLSSSFQERDLSIAFCLVAFTYTTVGVLFFISFPKEKDCIQQRKVMGQKVLGEWGRRYWGNGAEGTGGMGVLLDNFPASDVMTFIARLFLLFQLTTVFPLAMYVIRVQFMLYFFNKTYPSFLHVFILNFVLIGTCVLSAVVYPHVGDLLRYAGSLSGLAYDYALPCIAYMVIQKRKGQLSWLSFGFHSIIVLLGFANLMAQFFTAA